VRIAVISDIHGNRTAFDAVDRRAAYLLLDESTPTIRRVEYDMAKELKALSDSGLPHSDWIARTLESARPQMPSETR